MEDYKNRLGMQPRGRGPDLMKNFTSSLYFTQGNKELVPTEILAISILSNTGVQF